MTSSTCVVWAKDVSDVGEAAASSAAWSTAHLHDRHEEHRSADGLGWYSTYMILHYNMALQTRTVLQEYSTPAYTHRTPHAGITTPRHINNKLCEYVKGDKMRARTMRKF